MSLVLVGGVQANLGVQVDDLGDVGLSLLSPFLATLLFNLTLYPNLGRGCVSTRILLLGKHLGGRVVRKLGPGRAPNGVGTHVSHLSSHVVLLEGVNH